MSKKTFGTTSKGVEASLYEISNGGATIGWRFVNPLMAQHFGTDSMPETAENVAELLNISRADQDAFAWRSQQRAAQAQRDGILAQEIVPVQIVGRKGAVSDVREDEHPRPETTLEQLAKLKAPFRQAAQPARNSTQLRASRSILRRFHC